MDRTNGGEDNATESVRLASPELRGKEDTRYQVDMEVGRYSRDMPSLHEEGTRKMKHYSFKVTLSGHGNTAEEAWEDAIESFKHDPGEPYATTEEPDGDSPVTLCWDELDSHSREYILVLEGMRTTLATTPWDKLPPLARDILREQLKLRSNAMAELETYL